MTRFEETRINDKIWSDYDRGQNWLRIGKMTRFVGKKKDDKIYREKETGKMTRFIERRKLERWQDL